MIEADQLLLNGFCMAHLSIFNASRTPVVTHAQMLINCRFCLGLLIYHHHMRHHHHLKLQTKFQNFGRDITLIAANLRQRDTFINYLRIRVLFERNCWGSILYCMPPAASAIPWMPPLALARMVLTWLGAASTNCITG